jgi:hypothetical protein
VSERVIHVRTFRYSGAQLPALKQRKRLTETSRYANRIKNGTFTIDGQSYQIPENENGGHDTLHGGAVGYDARNWTVTQSDTSSITFGLYDPDGDQGFPGAVVSPFHDSGICARQCGRPSVDGSF